MNENKTERKKENANLIPNYKNTFESMNGIRNRLPPTILFYLTIDFLTLKIA